MGLGTNGLTFNTLRGANTARLPQFKNSKGGMAHSKQDGSDWSPAQWLQAMFGEIGEWAEQRVAFESGEITYAEFKAKSTREVADIQTYLDLFARRSLDTIAHPSTLPVYDVSPAQKLMVVIMHLGSYANARKKYERGDFGVQEYREQREEFLSYALDAMTALFHGSELEERTPHPADQVVAANQVGVNLGEATMEKFNQVSERVGSTIYMDAEDWHYRKPHDGEERRK